MKLSRPEVQLVIQLRPPLNFRLKPQTAKIRGDPQGAELDEYVLYPA